MISVLLFFQTISGIFAFEQNESSDSFHCKTSLSALVLGQLSPAETRTYLLKNLLFGVEGNFTHEFLRGLPNPGALRPKQFAKMRPQSFYFSGKENLDELRRAMQLPKGYLRLDQINLILNFLFDVLRPIHGELILFPKHLMIKDRDGKEYEIHSNALIIAFRGRLADGREFVLGIEDRSLEINIPPVTFDNLNFWRPIYRRALRAGFVGRTDLLPGGGGHMHLGFRSLHENLFVARPDVLAGFAILHLRHPEIMTTLGEANDRGAGSTSVVPYDLSREAAHQAEREIKAWVQKMIALRPGSPEALNYPVLREKLGALLPPLLCQHDSAVSLKHFSNSRRSADGTTFRRENPHVEVRYPNAFRSFAELSATADFLLSALAHEFQLPHSQAYSEFWWLLSRRTPEVSRQVFQDFAQKLNIDSRTIKTLLGMESAPQVPTQRLVVSNSLRGRVKAFRAPNSAPNLPHYVVSFKINSSDKPDALLVNGRQAFSWIFHGDRIYVWLPYYELEAMAYLVSIVKEDTLTKTFAIEFDPVNLTDHRIIISDEIPSAWDSQRYFDLLSIATDVPLLNPLPANNPIFQYLRFQLYQGRALSMISPLEDYLRSGEAVKRLHLSNAIEQAEFLKRIGFISFGGQKSPVKHFPNGWETIYYFDVPAKLSAETPLFLDSNGREIAWD